MAGADSTSLSPDALRQPTLAAVFALGGSCVITQLALMREMLGVFAGNELVLGATLGNWLLLMGLGAALGRWANQFSDPRPIIFRDSPRGTLRNDIPLKTVMITRGVRPPL